jgi:hypothetical protein
MTIAEYYDFLRDVQKMHYPNLNLNAIKKMKNVKHAYECKKIEEVYQKCNKVNHFKKQTRTISNSLLTKQMKYIPKTPHMQQRNFIPNMSNNLRKNEQRQF